MDAIENYDFRVSSVQIGTQSKTYIKVDVN